MSNTNAAQILAYNVSLARRAFDDLGFGSFTVTDVRKLCEGLTNASTKKALQTLASNGDLVADGAKFALPGADGSVNDPRSDADRAAGLTHASDADGSNSEPAPGAVANTSAADVEANAAAYDAADKATDADKALAAVGAVIAASDAAQPADADKKAKRARTKSSANDLMRIKVAFDLAVGLEEQEKYVRQSLTKIDDSVKRNAIERVVAGVAKDEAAGTATPGSDSLVAILETILEEMPAPTKASGGPRGAGTYKVGQHGKRSGIVHLPIPETFAVHGDRLQMIDCDHETGTITLKLVGFVPAADKAAA